jgi:hypothetical protein
MDTPVQSTQKRIVRREPLQIGGGVVPPARSGATTRSCI